MSKDEFLSILDDCFANGTPFIDYTPDYVYVLMPTAGDGSQWDEIVYMMDDSSIEKQSFDAEKAWLMLLEEFEKGLPGYVEDLIVTHIREVAEGLASQPAAERIRGLVADVCANPGSYSPNLPVVKNQGEIGDLKGKI